MTTQIEWIENKLLGFGKITRNECLRNYISRLSARIKDLEKIGYIFETSFVEVKTPFGKGKDYQYTVVEYPAGVKDKLSLEEIYDVIDDLDAIKKEDIEINALSLNECYFCESNDVAIAKMPILALNGKYSYYVRCCNCAGAGSRKDTADKAIKAWNRT